MPTLAKEPYLHPVTLLEAPGAAKNADDKQWWALYTMSRNEKTLMRKLCAQDRSYYCPVVARQSTSSRGLRTAYVPLFTNYVFLHGDEADRYAAVCTGHVSKVLPVTEADAFVEQMRSIQRVIDSGLDVELAPRFEIGSRVLVKSGPLKGLLGSVIKTRSKYRFVVHVDFLQQGASTIFDGWELERV